MQVLKRIVASLAIAAVLGCFGISAPAYAEDTIDSSNQSEQSSNASEYVAEGTELDESARTSTSSKILQPGNRYYTNVSNSYEAGLTPGLYLVSAVSTGIFFSFSALTMRQGITIQFPTHMLSKKTNLKKFE